MRVLELVKLGIQELEAPTYDVEDGVLEKNIFISWLSAPCFVVKVDDKIVGCAPLTLGSLPWSSKLLVSSILVYVLPEYRNSNIIKELYKEIKEYAELQGILYKDEFSCTGKIDARLRLARRQNLKQSGINIYFDGRK